MMRIPDEILLFDIDSVLVEPLGYRAALNATLNRIISQIGFDETLLPDVDTIEYFEAMHITSEWDMAPIILAVLLDSLALLHPALSMAATIEELKLIEQAGAIQEIDYRETVQVLSNQLVSGEFPSATALRIASSYPSQNGNLQRGLFPHLAGSRLLASLLTNTRDPYRSVTTRYFQHYSLGSQVYSQVYGLPPDFEAVSKLKSCDKALLQPEIRDEILTLYEQGRVSMAAITNRPSSPPREVSGVLLGYPPEAEMALELNELSRIPLIGFGRLRYVAEQYGLETEVLLKPSPVHVLAAILAAITDDELASIQAAVQMSNLTWKNAQQHRDLPKSILHLRDMSTTLHVHVFEDTRWGIEAAYHAGQILSSVGVANEIHARGIAQNAQKVNSLSRMGAQVYPNISEALRRSVSAP